MRQNQVSLALDPTQANKSGKRDLTLRGLSCSCRRVTVNQCDRPLRQERNTAGSLLCVLFCVVYALYPKWCWEIADLCECEEATDAGGAACLMERRVARVG